MKLRKKAFVSFVCSLVLAGNSVGVLAQDKPQTQEKQKVTIKTSDGQTKDFVIEGNGVISVDQNGQQVRINRTQGENISGQMHVKMLPDGIGSAVFYSQSDAAVQNLQGENFIFTRGQGDAGQTMTFSFVSSEMSFDNKLVKGAPFSADSENETVQTLANGNRIVRKSSGAIYRDSEGRTRRENTINAVGPFAGNDATRTITINDSVAGTIYSLEPQSRVARKIGFARTQVTAARPSATAEATNAPKKITVSGGVLQGSALKKPQPAYPAVAKAAKASGAVQVQISISEEGKVTDASVVSGHPLLRDASLDAARQWEFKPVELSGTPVKVQGVLTFNFTLAGDENKEANQDTTQTPMTFNRRGPEFKSNIESLGKQIIEGIEAEGKRTTMTIPVGAIGNEREIEIVSENWYSPELQTVILSKRNDPTTGETTYRLTNIHRGDPDASLFQIPSDYTVKEGGVTGGFGVGVETQPVIRKRTPNQ